MWFLTNDLGFVINEDAIVELVAADQIGIAGHVCF
jgi:hypothetical protein